METDYKDDDEYFDSSSDDEYSDYSSDDEYSDYSPVKIAGVPEEASVVESEAGKIKALMAMRLEKTGHAVYGGGQGRTYHNPSSTIMVPIEEMDAKKTKLAEIYTDKTGTQVAAVPKSAYFGHRPKQLMRWLSTVIQRQFGLKQEVQCYLSLEQRRIIVGINEDNKISSLENELDLCSLFDFLTRILKLERKDMVEADRRGIRHYNKLMWLRDKIVRMDRENMENKDKPLPPYVDFLFDVAPVVPRHPRMHAEAKIWHYLKMNPLNIEMLGGIKPPCVACAVTIFGEDTLTAIMKNPTKFIRAGPLWNTVAAMQGPAAKLEKEHSDDLDTRREKIVKQMLQMPTSIRYGQSVNYQNDQSSDDEDGDMEREEDSRGGIDGERERDSERDSEREMDRESERDSESVDGGSDEVFEELEAAVTELLVAEEDGAFDQVLTELNDTFKNLSIEKLDESLDEVFDKLWNDFQKQLSESEVNRLLAILQSLIDDVEKLREKGSHDCLDEISVELKDISDRLSTEKTDDTFKNAFVALKKAVKALLIDRRESMFNEMLPGLENAIMRLITSEDDAALTQALTELDKVVKDLPIERFEEGFDRAFEKLVYDLGRDGEAVEAKFLDMCQRFIGNVEKLPMEQTHAGYELCTELRNAHEKLSAEETEYTPWSAFRALKNAFTVLKNAVKTLLIDLRFNRMLPGLEDAVIQLITGRGGISFDQAFTELDEAVKDLPIERFEEGFDKVFKKLENDLENQPSGTENTTFLGVFQELITAVGELANEGAGAGFKQMFGELCDARNKLLAEKTDDTFENAFVTLKKAVQMLLTENMDSTLDKVYQELNAAVPNPLELDPSEWTVADMDNFVLGLREFSMKVEDGQISIRCRHRTGIEFTGVWESKWNFLYNKLEIDLFLGSMGDTISDEVWETYDQKEMKGFVEEVLGPEQKLKTVEQIGQFINYALKNHLFTPR